MKKDLKSNQQIRAHVAVVRDMFSYCRPSGTPTEQSFIDRFLTPLGFRRDTFNNLVVTIGDNPKILWSSHVDTVHYDEGFQTTDFNWDTGILQLSKKSRKHSSCLGADDTAGIWLMTEMIKEGVPGVYVIHHAEESGCVGSSNLAKFNPEFFNKIDFAIAFDRRGYDSIVTHQCGLRTASDLFADDFARIMDDAYGCAAGLKADDGGVYTDTNEYAHLVPECTNISVGYFSQHSRNETQNVYHLIAMRNALVKADFSKLVAYRDPDKVESLGRYSFGKSGYSGSFGGHYGWDEHDYDPWSPPEHSNKSKPKHRPQTLVDAVEAYPDIAADILQAYGLSYTEFMMEVAATLGEAYADVV